MDIDQIISFIIGLLESVITYVAGIEPDQIMIGVFGALAIGMTQQRKRVITENAWIPGLVGQPFFLVETWKADQAGQFVVAVLVTAIWLQGGYNAYIRRRERLAQQANEVEGV